MSIFRSTFSPSVKTQLGHRQKAMTNRTPQNLQYLNSRNAWIRMSSSVNVNGSSDLAKKYVLQGGTLNYSFNQSKNQFSLTSKSGLGTFQNAYSNKAADGTRYNRGIRPMPGITNMDIKSLSAYGSLREITINFQCWDIKQLEDLELLYMRPGYTVLVEWGWAPYLDNNGEYKSNFFDYYDILHKGATNRTTLFKDLYDKSVKYGGNYDAMFGYIKNYQWSARPDGGYDCQTVIISTGEIIESLKINYLLPDKIEKKEQGKLIKEFSSPGNSTQWIDAYKKNILAGIWAEMYYKGKDPSAPFIYGNGSAFDIKGDIQTITVPLSSTNPNPDSLSAGSSIQVYISLNTMCNIFNSYITAKSKTDLQALVKLSLKSNDYEGTPEDLLCTAHPLQVSVDPSVCLIKSPIWYDGGGGSEVINTATASVETNISLSTAKEAFDLIKKGYEGGTFGGTNEESLIAGFAKVTNKDIYTSLIGLIANNSDSDYKTIDSILNGELEENNLDVIKSIQSYLEKVAGIKVSFTTLQRSKEPFDSYLEEKSIKVTANFDTQAATNVAASETTIALKASRALSNLSFLKDLTLDYFYKDTFSEIGIIKNIYVNVDYLYLKAIDASLEGSDSKEKNEINLYNYLKKVISDIQAAIGNVSNFEIHVDPISNNVARIIDVNYTEPNKSKYKDLFQLEVHNLESVVRSYSLQSQIFPNQSAAIAIGAQAKGGQLGIQNNTVIDFNRNLTDRIIPEKVDGLNSPTPTVVGNKPTITNGIAQIISLFASLSKDQPKVDSGPTTTDYTTLANNAKNALRDVIAYFQTITKSPGSNRNLIPTKFSAEMDGIGGLVIGHMFRLPDNIMPKGYRGVDGVGVKLGNAITRIGHSIGGGDWTTKIETLNIVLEEEANPEDIDFASLDLSTIKTIISEAVAAEAAGGTASTNIPAATGGGSINYMKQAGNIVFRNSGTDSRCAQYTYNIARDYVNATKGQAVKGLVEPAGGNANDAAYRTRLQQLGYTMYSLGTLTKQQLIDQIKGTWNVGDIINYRSTVPTGGNNYAYTYGHTQIYTGRAIDIGGKHGGGSNRTPWASSWADNYGLDFVYSRKPSDSWEVYIFRAPTA